MSTPRWPSGDAPDAPPAPATADPPHRGLVLACVASVLVVAAVVVALVVGGDEDPEARTGASPSSAVGVPPSGGPGASPGPTRLPVVPPGPTTQAPVASPTADIEPATGATVTAPRAGVSLTLPERWAGAQLEDGPAAASRQLYPDDAAQATRTESVLGNLPGSAVLFGLDIEAAERGARFTPNLNVLVDGSVPASLDLEQTTAAQVRGLRTAFTVLRQDALDVGDVEMERVTYRSAEQGFTGLAYIAKEQGVTYVLTYTFPTLTTAAQALADGSASTFALG